MRGSGGQQDLGDMGHFGTKSTPCMQASGRDTHAGALLVISHAMLLKKWWAQSRFQICMCMSTMQTVKILFDRWREPQCSFFRGS